MGITVDRVIYYEKLSVKPKSLDESVEVDYGNERKTTLADFVASDEPTPEEIVINSAVEDMIRECVSELTPREQEILWARLDKTLEEVGEMFGLTRERIRQIEKRAIKKLRNPLSKVIGGK